MLASKKEIFWLFNTTTINHIPDSSSLFLKNTKRQPLIYLSLVLISLDGIFHIIYKYLKFAAADRKNILLASTEYLIASPKYKSIELLQEQIPKLKIDNTSILLPYDYKNLKSFFYLSLWDLSRLYLRNCIKLLSMSSLIKKDIWKLLFHSLLSNLVNASFFQALLTNKNNHLSVDTCFLFNDMNIFSHVVADLDFHSIYFPHGLMGKSNPFFHPNFEQIFFRSSVESNYLKKKIKFQGKLIKMKPINVPKRTSTALIFMRQSYLKELRQLQDIIKFFQSLGIDTAIKRHPSDLSELNFLADLDASFPVKEIVGLSFEEALRNVAPIFVVGWVSTALVDALESNIIPISLMNDEVPQPTVRNFYPFEKKALSFQNKDIIEEAFNNSDIYDQYLKKLHSHQHYK